MLYPRNTLQSRHSLIINSFHSKIIFITKKQYALMLIQIRNYFFYCKICETEGCEIQCFYAGNMNMSSKYIYWVVFQEAWLSFVMCYPMDAYEAFVGALHLIYYPQANWAREEWIYWKGPWRSLLLNVNSVWTRPDSKVYSLVLGINFIATWRLFCSHHLW